MFFKLWLLQLQNQLERVLSSTSQGERKPGICLLLFNLYAGRRVYTQWSVSNTFHDGVGPQMAAAVQNKLSTPLQVTSCSQSNTLDCHEAGARLSQDDTQSVLLLSVVFSTMIPDKSLGQSEVTQFYYL